jgi:hypothetical protein
MKPGDTSLSEAASERHAPLALWRVAQAFLGVLHVLFGDPEDVARRHTLTGKAHKFMAGWLRCAEALMRRLIVLEAASFPKPNTRPLLRPSRQRVRRLIGFDAEHPEKWRVSFRCFLGDTHARQAPRQDERCPAGACVSPKTRISREDRWNYTQFKAVRFRSAWPLAERYEALLRVFNNPAPYAARVARRLHATPHRLIEALAAPPEAEHRVDQFALLGEQARAAWFSSA